MRDAPETHAYSKYIYINSDRKREEDKARPAQSSGYLCAYPFLCVSQFLSENKALPLTASYRMIYTAITVWGLALSDPPPPPRVEKGVCCAPHEEDSTDNKERCIQGTAVCSYGSAQSTEPVPSLHMNGRWMAARMISLAIVASF